jgi:hypothetical protein
MRAGRRIVSGNSDMATGFMAKLSKAPDLLALDDRQIAARDLNESTGDSAHDESEEERVSLLASAAEVGHEGGPMNAWGKWINKVEEKLDDLKEHFSRSNILEAMWAIIVIERR